MKTHLLDSSEPITEGRTQTAICGTEVKDAGFVAQGEDVGRMSVSCYRCCKTGIMTKKYRYIIATGEEILRRGEREAAV